MAKMTVVAWAKDNGIEAKLDARGEVDLEARLELAEVCREAIFDGTCPAVCDEGCEVEPDGECEHGAESLLLAIGLI